MMDAKELTTEQAKLQEELRAQLAQARLLVAEALQVRKSGIGRPDERDKADYADALMRMATALIMSTATEAKIHGIYMVNDSGLNPAVIRREVARALGHWDKGQRRNGRHNSSNQAAKVAAQEAAG